MMSGRNRFPFTASQWQELEHQALIFKYIISGMPIPPDLLFAVKRSYVESPLSSKLFPLQSQQVGWNCFQMGLGRKIDPEPGRCRRTDGKKWRCSKEAYPDSKYCERHMHRGKNRSRKPVEVSSVATNNPSITRNNLTLTQASHSLSSFSSETHHLQQPSYSTTNYLYPHTPSARPPGMGLSLQENSTHLLLDSGSCSQPSMDYRSNRHVYGLKEEVDEHAFFSEPSGTIRSFSGSSVDDSWNFTPLTMGFSSKQKDSSSMQNEHSYLQLQSLNSDSRQNKQDQHFYIMGSDIKCDMQRDHEPQKTVHRFFDEWPLKGRESSWLDLDDKSSNSTSASTTRLSISIPTTSSHDFPTFSSRTDC